MPKRKRTSYWNEYHHRPKVHNKRVTLRAARNKEFRDHINSLKQQPCMDCGGVFPPECMDFDHVRGEKKFNISSAYRSKKSLEAEIAKCDLVCANCHRTRTHSRLG